MASLGAKSVRTKAIVVQLVIVAGLVVWFKMALPRIERAREAAEVAERERKIQKFFDSMVVENTPSDADAPSAKGEKRAQPQRLRLAASVEDVERALGAPDANMTDFRGGQHLTWTGTRHKLEASFNKGTLYALTFTDLSSGHGTMVFESSAQWREF